MNLSRFRPLSLLVLMAAPAAAAVPTEAEVEAFALGRAKPQVDRILKAPAGAEYGVYRLKPLGQTAIYPGNRYRVEGYVDANNVLGTKLRAEWDAVVHINPQDKLVLLGVTFTGTDGEADLIYEAAAEAWCRPDVYRTIHDEYDEEIAAIAAARRKLPVRARKKYTDRQVAQYLASVRRKYGLTPSQLVKILGL